MPAEKVCVIDLDDKAEYQRLLGGKPQTCGMRAGRVFLPPGQDCGEHSTNSQEELLVFLAGQGEVIIGKGTLLRVGVGKISYIPPDTAHNVRNTGNEPLVYIYCVVPVNRNQEKSNE